MASKKDKSENGVFTSAIDGTKKAKDWTKDQIDKVSTPASRSGNVVNRVARLVDAGVDPDVIALQMRKNSPRGNTYHKRDIYAYYKLYEDTKTRAPLTEKVTRALKNDEVRNVAGKNKGKIDSPENS
ncbi:hypothetical protein [Marinobacterium rhizophilum]|uniref:hypothetical protein n=1 Tax=Marinobacterium rhizophilum TaxID=420402 RepID=UPI0012EB3FE6|nr:hypothetical protein [Marinobacterium rhizophilum]